jgi:hypothetical protein
MSSMYVKDHNAQCISVRVCLINVNEMCVAEKFSTEMSEVILDAFLKMKYEPLQYRRSGWQNYSLLFCELRIRRSRTYRPVQWIVANIFTNCALGSGCGNFAAIA